MEYKILDETEQKIMSYLWCHESGCTEKEIQRNIRILGLKQKKQKEIALHLKELENAGYVKKKCISGEYLFVALTDKNMYLKMFANSKMQLETFSAEDKMRILKTIESLENP